MGKEVRIRPLTAIICDDIRIENTNKRILIGIYADEMEIGRMPADVLLSLELFIEIKGVGEVPFSLRVEGPKGSNTVEVSGSFSVEEQPRRYHHSAISMPRFPLRIQNPGNIVVKFKQHNERWQTVRVLPVVERQAASDI